MKRYIFLAVVMLWASLASAEYLRFRVFGTSTAHDTIYTTEVDTLMFIPTPGIYVTGVGLIPKGVAGGDDSLLVKWRPLMREADSMATAGSPFFNVPWLLTASTVSQGNLNYTDDSYYYSYVPDTLIGVDSDIQQFEPPGCEAFQFLVSAATTDTVEYKLILVYRYIHE